MIEISKDLAQYINKNKPEIFIYKTMKPHGGKHGKYYVEEGKKTLRQIERYKSQFENVVEEYPAR